MPTLFTEEKPSFYTMDQIYDPITNPTGQIIPRPGSIVIDPLNEFLMQGVKSVDDNDQTVTYEPVHTSLLTPTPGVTPQDTSLQSMIDYGNSRFYLYYDNRETPTKLTVDKKIIIPGNDAENYVIMKKNLEDGSFDPVSQYYDEQGAYVGNSIPLQEVGGVSGIKYCSNCHIGVPIAEGEVYYVFIYDYAGTQTGEIKLFAKPASVTNILNDDLLIEDFVLTGSQETGGDFYLYPGQDVDSLVIAPKLVFSDGSEQLLAINGSTCHLYGFEGFVPAFPGQETEILVKFFLGDGQQAAGDFVDSSGGTRFLFARRDVKVLTPQDTTFYYKISVIPYYLSGTATWSLIFVLYEVGELPVIITQYVSFDPAEFDGQDFDNNQTIQLSFNLKDIHPELDNDQIVLQDVTIRLTPFANYERYTIRDSPGDVYGIYGVEDVGVLSRPVVYFDYNTDQYFIPTSKFATEALVLEAFYYKARPVFDTDAGAQPVTPTHFTVRDTLGGGIQLAAPIAIADYASAWSILDADPALYRNRNLIVEFLKDQGGGNYDYLYGVPVDVHDGLLP